LVDMLGIIILNYNTWNESIKCIESIREHTRTPYRIYLVDNASPVKPSDEELNILDTLEYTEIIYSSKNDGYAAGNNIGLKKAISDGCNHFCICNSDVLFVDDSLDQMVEALNQDKSMAIAGPKIFSPDGIFEPLTMVRKKRAIDILRLMALDTPLKIFLRWFEKKQIIKDEITNKTRVYSVAGSCFVISRYNINSVYPLDEHTFLFEEEEIIGARVKAAGKNIFVIPKTHVIHAHSKSTGAPSRKTYKYMIDSEQYYLKEYLHTGWFMRNLILFIRKIMMMIKYK